MSKFGYLKWNNRDETASIVIYSSFELWPPVTQLDALLDAKYDLEEKIKVVRERCFKVFDKHSETDSAS